MILEKTERYRPQFRNENVEIAKVGYELGDVWGLLGEQGPAPVDLMLGLWGMGTKWGTDEVYNNNWAKRGVEVFNTPETFDRCWTMVVTSEWLTKPQIEGFQRYQGGHLVSQDKGPNTEKMTDNGRKYLTWFEPPHRVTKRPAYERSVDGIVDYMFMLFRLYSGSPALWDAFRANDCKAVCYNLKQLRWTQSTLEALENRVCGSVRKARITVASSPVFNHSLVYDMVALQWYQNAVRRLKNGEIK